MPVKVFLMSFFSKWKLFWTVIVFIVFYAFGLAPFTGDLQQELALVLVSFVFAHFSMPWFKRFFIKKTVAFDMGGVFVQGDFFTQEQTETPGMRKLIKDLKHNYKVALATNNNALAFVSFNQKFGFSMLFDYVLVSGEIGVKKPDEAYFKKLVEVTGSKPSDIVFFDDDAANVEAAKKVGLKGVLFKSAEEARAELRKLGLKA